MDLNAFQKFLKLCAGRVGQLLNMSSLAVETGVDSKTIASWIAVLETSFIVFRLQPHFKNFNKRIVKMPKLYFYDTGLAASLLGIKEVEQLSMNVYRGALFENMVVLEFMKRLYNNIQTPQTYFWRDNTGHEIDLILERKNELIPVEIKSGQTPSSDFFKGIQFWRKITQNKKAFVVYDGPNFFTRSDAISLVPLHQLDRVLSD
jgi:predicted AAA+ superfamily ATPase